MDIQEKIEKVLKDLPLKKAQCSGHFRRIIPYSERVGKFYVTLTTQEKKETHSVYFESSTGFLKLSTVDILDRIIIWGGGVAVMCIVWFIIALIPKPDNDKTKKKKTIDHSNL